MTKKQEIIRHDFADGKYTVINDNGKLTALRHGEPWARDLTGDNLVYWMLVEVDALKAENQRLAEALDASAGRAADGMEAQTTSGTTPSIPPKVEDDAAGKWRALALQFDAHRMQAMSHLRALLDNPAQHAEQVVKFLKAPPPFGEQVLADRIAALAHTTSQNAKPAVLSGRLVALLRHAKQLEPDLTLKGVSTALADLYSPYMSMVDAMHHLVAALEEVMTEPRFEAGAPETCILELLLAPVKGTHSVDMLGPKSLSTAYTLEQFYGAQASYIWSKLRLTRMDWCRDQLALQPA